MSVPIRASLSVSALQGQVIMLVPVGPGYYVSAQQGQAIMSGPGYYVSAQQGQVSVPSRANSVAGVVYMYLRLPASFAVVSAPY